MGCMDFVFLYMWTSGPLRVSCCLVVLEGKSGVARCLLRKEPFDAAVWVELPRVFAFGPLALGVILRHRRRRHAGGERTASTDGTSLAENIVPV